MPIIKNKAQENSFKRKKINQFESAKIFNYLLIFHILSCISVTFYLSSTHSFLYAVLLMGSILCIVPYILIKLASEKNIIAIHSNDRIRVLEEDAKMLIKERDEALLSAKAKMDFLASMSHEIRTPMNAILGFSDIMINDNDINGENKENINLISSSAKHLLGVINDILDFSKIQNGKLKLEYISSNIHKLTYETIKSFDSQLKSKNVNYIIDIDEKIPEIVKLDPVRYRQILTNLFGNAIKFTPSEGVIAVKFEEEKRTKDSITISVSMIDTGIGIPKEKQSSIFNAFEQAELSQTRKFGGTGLGLSITEQLLSQMNGKISVRSSENIGTCFNFNFQVLLSDENLEDSNNIENQIHLRENLKILVAEDNLINQKLISKILERFGCKYSLVNNGIEAVKSAKKEAFDLILMDIQMPELDGLEATKQIREYEKQNNIENKTPIIALTAHVLERDRKNCIENGMNSYVSKPINVHNLKQEISRVTS